MRKKVIALLLTVVTVVSLTGCGSKYKEYISVDKYKNMKLTTTEELSTEKISKDTVNNQIRHNICMYSPTFLKETDKGITENDCISFEGTVKTKDGTTTDFTASNEMMSSFKNIKGFKKAVIGHIVGDKFSFEIEDNNTTMTADIKITSVVSDPLELFTNDWVKNYSDNSNIKTTKKYYDYIKDELKTNAKNTNKSIKLTAIMKKIEKSTELKKYPDGAVKDELKVIKAQYDKMAELYNVTIKENIMANNNLSTNEEYENFLKKMAKDQVKENLIYCRIAEIEKLTPTEDEYQTYLKDYKSEHANSYDSLDIVGKKVAKQYILNEIVQDWLVEHNTVKES